MNIFFFRNILTQIYKSLETATEFDPELACVWASVLNYDMHAIHHDAQHGLTLPSLYKGRAREQGNERKMIKTVFLLYILFSVQ